MMFDMGMKTNASSIYWGRLLICLSMVWFWKVVVCEVIIVVRVNVCSMLNAMTCFVLLLV